MKIDDFLKKGITGGWKYKNYIYNNVEFCNGWLVNFNEDDEKGRPRQMWLEAILLDPKFWEAVGKTEGWNKEIHQLPPSGLNHIFYNQSGNHMFGLQIRMKEWQIKMQEFVYILCKGQTIEEAINLI